jgi:hypothetical protein
VKATEKMTRRPDESVDNLPGQTEEEVFTALLSREGMRIERIVSTGQSTPVD